VKGRLNILEIDHEAAEWLLSLAAETPEEEASLVALHFHLRESDG
jgi:hypothetical protein